jgi:thiol:disulfide interchange protein DsbD
LLFVALALSLFGLYTIQMPSRLQSRMNEISNRQRSGTYLGVAVMGLLSALIIGPCAGPVLIAALTYISNTGDAVLGGVALFAMGQGMGLPLLIIGTTGGRLLPKAGPWMDRIKRVFGVILLAVALMLIERVLPARLTPLLWAAWFIGGGAVLGGFELLRRGGALRRFWSGLGLVSAAWGLVLLLGMTGIGGIDAPLRRLGINLPSPEGTQSESLAFKRIKSVADLQRELTAARAQHKTVMLDFYADWCTYCIQMEHRTFTDPAVRAALADTVLLQADVTANDATDKALMQHLGVFLPPAVLLFRADGEERRELRVVQFLDAPGFIARLSQAFPEATPSD